jgi:hypothetical protein
MSLQGRIVLVQATITRMNILQETLLQYRLRVECKGLKAKFTLDLEHMTQLSLQ